MKTIVTDSPETAAEYIRSGQVAAFPTETVYGLGADAFRPDAVREIFEAKDRPADNPLIVHVADRDQIQLLAVDLQPYTSLLVDRFFPGPLTLVVRKAKDVPSVVTAGLDTVGIRMPDHKLARAFLSACGVAVAAPSANRSGRPSPTSWQAVLEDLDGRISCILRGGRTEIGLESTVVDCTGRDPVVLRSGGLTLEDLRSVIPGVQALEGQEDDAVARSPGLRHRHYAPDARVELFSEPPAKPVPRSAYIGLAAPAHATDFELIRVCRDVHEYAYDLFDFFRACDAMQVATIYCEQPREVGLGVALMDRLRRAADRST